MKTMLAAAAFSLMLGLLGCGHGVGPSRTAAPEGSPAGEGAPVALLDAAAEAEPDLGPEQELEPGPELEPEAAVRDLPPVPSLDRIPPEKKPMEGLFETTLDIEEADGKLDIRFSLKNVSGKDLQITHGSGQQYDIWIYNDRDEEVYRWSHNKAFTQALIVRGLGDSEQLSFEEEWDLRDSNGEPVPAGTYTVAVEVMIGMDEGTIDRGSLKAQSTVELSPRP